ncbi:MAG TPA: ATP-dependent Clp protease proteolytic subunit [Flavobacteriales bacterium]|nr:ATP-dependent Clp protease proteolytic subunit [Flavobacteriales bacterium]HMR28551.1 ATP-dependent Clp protease proteolytic subunit [Flavobacteriales bacterium]
MANARRYPFQCSAERKGRTLRVVMSGIIDVQGRNSSALLAERLAELQEGDALEVVLRNLYGGNVYEGTTMYHDLVALKPRMVVDGVCASMAVPIMLAGAQVHASKHSRLMLHRVQGVVSGDADQITQYAQQTQEVEDELVAIIAQRTGLKEAEVRAQYMVTGKDTWLTAEQALKAKLVDKVTSGSLLYRAPEDSELEEAADPEALLASWTNCIKKPTGAAGQPKPMNKEQLKALGLPEDATEAQVNEAINNLNAKAKRADDMQRERDQDAEREATALIETALQQNRLTKEQADELKGEVKAAPAMALKMVKTVVNAAVPHQPVKDQLRTGAAAGAATGAQQAAAGREGWDYKRWAKEDPRGLQRMQAENKAQFDALKAAYVTGVNNR